MLPIKVGMWQAHSKAQSANDADTTGRRHPEKCECGHSPQPSLIPYDHEADVVGITQPDSCSASLKAVTVEGWGILHGLAFSLTMPTPQT